MKSRRRTYFIKKRFQSEVILKIALVWFLGVIFGTAVLYFLSKETITAYYQGGNLIMKSTSEIILRKMLISALINFFVTIALGIFLMLFISHRLAGPLYRFEKTLEDMIDGKVDFQIKLRKKDELVDLVPKFNELLKTYNEKIRELKILVEKLKEEDLSEKERESIVSQIEKELNFFKTR